MMTARSLVFACAIGLATPTSIHAGSGCTNAFRAAFQKASAPFRMIQKAASDLLNRRGRAQAKDVRRIMEEQWKKAEESHSGADRVNADQIWQDHLAKWENDILRRMGGGKKTYPSLNELLAFMAAKSPTFKGQLMEYLATQSSIRYRLMAHFFQGRRITYGRRFWELWRGRLRLPARRTWTIEDFAVFETEVSATMFKVMNPEPGFYVPWVKSFFSLKVSIKNAEARWPVLSTFVEKFHMEWRAKFEARLKGVHEEVAGVPREVVIRDFLDYGIQEALYQRLGAIIKERKLGAGFKKDIVFNQEVQRLALDLEFFLRPVVAGLFIYWIVDETVLPYYASKEAYRKFEEDVRNNPDKYLPRYEHGDADRMKNFDEQLEHLTVTKLEIESELKGATLSEGDKQLRRNILEKINAKIALLQDLKVDAIRKITDVHP